MNTQKLIYLLKYLINLEQGSDYLTSFRFTDNPLGSKCVAVDVIYNKVNIFHSLVYSDEGIDELIKSLKDIGRSPISYRVYYRDEYINIEEITPSMQIAEAKAFVIKQKYNIECEIIETVEI